MNQLMTRLVARLPRPTIDAEGATWFGAGLVSAVCGFLGFELVLGPALAAQAAPVPPRPTPPPVRIQVAGEVLRPGAYDLPPTARVEDAVRVAGGATDQADVSSLNQAAHRFDGQRVVVPRTRTFETARPFPTRTPAPVIQPTPGPRAPPGSPALGLLVAEAATGQGAALGALRTAADEPTAEGEESNNGVPAPA